ncbi:SRPBCC family protein [Dyella sp. C9]|uniref:SRPBCC family protein n=1 Tax=Dyella sp. C9 TaxID=2202154 RepID=UPI0013004A49|nr:SRPBCC family protein [Dyella sp. C9]
MRTCLIALLCPLALCATGARAEVKEAGADHLLLQDHLDVRTPPDQLYATVVDIGHWWNGAHTYSGDATHLSLQPEAGGCFCERWGGYSVAHGRVIWAAPGHVLRLEAPLGPLQSMAVEAVMTFTFKPSAQGTALEFEYRVNGSSASGLDKLAAGVDAVLSEQLQRLQRYAETGTAPPARP